jgi:hypothetical protein
LRSLVFRLFCMARAFWSSPLLGFDFVVVDFFTLEVGFGLEVEVEEGRGGRKGLGGMFGDAKEM